MRISSLFYFIFYSSLSCLSACRPFQTVLTVSSPREDSTLSVLMVDIKLASLWFVG